MPVIPSTAPTKSTVARTIARTATTEASTTWRTPAATARTVARGEGSTGRMARTVSPIVWRMRGPRTGFSEALTWVPSAPAGHGDLGAGGDGDRPGDGADDLTEGGQRAVTRLLVAVPAARSPPTAETMNRVRAASIWLAKTLVAAAVVRTGRPAGTAVAAERAMAGAAQSMAEFRLAAAWRALIGSCRPHHDAGVERDRGARDPEPSRRGPRC